MAAEIVRFDIRGIDRAMTNLARLDDKARRRVVQGAVRAGNKVIVKEARSRAPVRLGKLRRNIRGSVKRDRVSGTITGTVKPKATKKQRKSGLAAFYAHMAIGGTRPHKITPHPRRRRAMLKVNGQFYKEIEHPGARANNFLEAAASASFHPAMVAFEKAYAKKFNDELAKLPKGTTR